MEGYLKDGYSRMMPSRDKIVQFTNELLHATQFPDYAPSGLQVVGAPEVTRIACGVSASLELFRKAREIRANMLLVHHGMFWDNDPRIIDHTMRLRLEELFTGGISLVAYHLCLDAHPTIGNNALLANALDLLPDRDPFSSVGIGGNLTTICPPAELVTRIEKALGRAPTLFTGGPDIIKRIAICTGSAADTIKQAADEGYDCLITGEPRESTMMAARELGITFIAAGHYATETFGIKKLAEVTAEEFSIPWDFIDLYNPV